MIFNVIRGHSIYINSSRHIPYPSPQRFCLKLSTTRWIWLLLLDLSALFQIRAIPILLINIPVPISIFLVKWCHPTQLNTFFFWSIRHQCRSGSFPSSNKSRLQSIDTDSKINLRQLVVVSPSLSRYTRSRSRYDKSHQLDIVLILIGRYVLHSVVLCHGLVLWIIITSLHQSITSDE